MWKLSWHGFCGCLLVTFCLMASTSWAQEKEELQQELLNRLYGLPKISSCQQAIDWQVCLANWVAIEMMFQPESQVQLAYARLLRAQTSQSLHVDLQGLHLHSLPPLGAVGAHIQSLDLRGNPLEYVTQDVWQSYDALGIAVEKGAAPHDQSQQLVPLALLLGEYVMQHGQSAEQGQVVVAAARIKQAFLERSDFLSLAQLNLRQIPDVWSYLSYLRVVDVRGNQLDESEQALWRQELARHGIFVLQDATLEQAGAAKSDGEKKATTPEETTAGTTDEQFACKSSKDEAPQACHRLPQAMQQVSELLEDVLQAGCSWLPKIQHLGQQMHEKLGAAWRKRFEDLVQAQGEEGERIKKTFEEEKERLEKSWQQQATWARS